MHGRHTHSERWFSVLAEWEQQQSKDPLGSHVPHVPFRWSTNACTRDQHSEFRQLFEPDPTLPTHQDFSDFSAYFIDKNKKIVAFDSLDGKTRLVVPAPLPGKNFATLFHFLKEAPKSIVSALFQHVAQEINAMFDRQKELQAIFVSTHGHGVPYLHVRLEAEPKYYTQKARTLFDLAEPSHTFSMFDPVQVMFRGVAENGYIFILRDGTASVTVPRLHLSIAKIFSLTDLTPIPLESQTSEFRSARNQHMRMFAKNPW